MGMSSLTADAPRGSTRSLATRSDATQLAARASTPLLIAHVVLILFSTWALCTFLAGPPPAWLQTPANQKVLRFTKNP